MQKIYGSILSRPNFGKPKVGLSFNALKIEGISTKGYFSLNPFLISANAPNFGGIEVAPFLGTPQF